MSIAIKKRVINLVFSLGTFSVLYTLTNLYADTLWHLEIYKHDVDNVLLSPAVIHTLALPIDTHIPFIGMMIIPYSWSLVLFCASFFLVKTPTQLTLLTRRLVLATLFACFIFYLFPARFSFSRPVITDWTRIGYQFLAITDKPYNQFPSLHVTYALLLGGSLWHSLKSPLSRTMLLINCLLIIFSTVFTYQHHFFDLLGGLVLAAAVWHIASRMRNNLVLKYLTAAIGGFLMIMIGSHLTVYQLTLNTYFPIAQNWSNMGLTVMAILSIYWLSSFLTLAWAYQHPNITRNQTWFCKTNTGKLSLSTRAAFLPLLASYYFMWRLNSLLSLFNSKFPNNRLLQSLNKPPSICFASSSLAVIATAKLPQTSVLFSYSICDSKHHALMSGAKKVVHNKRITTPFRTLIVVDLAAEVSSHYSNKTNNPLFSEPVKSLSTCYLYFPLLDLQPLTDISTDNFINLFRKIDGFRSNNDSPVLINFHCVMGLSRSVALQTLYLLYCGKLNINNYKQWSKDHYPNAHINDNYLSKALIKQLTQIG